MSEVPGSRPELDDTTRDDWLVSFLVMNQEALSENEAYKEFSPVLLNISPEFMPFMSLEDRHARLTMKFENLTQRHAAVKGYEELLSAFEEAGKLFTTVSVRMAPASVVTSSLATGSAVAFKDVSLEVIDIERGIQAIHDID